MAKLRTVLRVLVGSPGDVSEERGLLEAAIRDVNVMTSKSTSVHLELVRWETHAHPDFASDPQDVINQQLEDDYDIFIGVLWTRFGTPTGRASSGTEEEFKRAYQRHKSDPASIRMMIYFRTTPVPPDTLDPKQLQLILEFRNGLGAAGGLYWKYGDLGEFENLIRMHLTRQAQEWGNSWGKSADTTISSSRVATLTIVADRTNTESALTGSEEEEEEGFLELIETGTEKMEEFKASATRITDAVVQLGNKISKRGSEVEKLAGPGKANIGRAKAIMERTSKDMSDCAVVLESDVAVFGNAVSRALDAYAKGAVLASRFEGGSDRLHQVHDEIATILGVATTARENMMGFRNSIATVPPFTTNLLRAKKRLLSVLDKLDVEFGKALNLLDSLKSMLQSARGAIN